MVDIYSLKARIYPVVVSLFPILVTGTLLSIQFDSIYASLSSLGLLGVTSYLLSQLGRDRGKRKEKALWESWGGPPTTIFLRLADTSLDKYTKARYHARMKEFCSDIDIPTLLAEQQDPSGNDEIYEAWVRYLLGKTRDTKKFHLLFKENVNYGFRRNLWALKGPAILFIILSAIANYMVEFKSTGLINPMSFSYSYWIASAVLIILLIFWLTTFTTYWVKVQAFDYARRLCEAIDNLD